MLSPKLGGSARRGRGKGEEVGRVVYSRSEAWVGIRGGVKNTRRKWSWEGGQRARVIRQRARPRFEIQQIKDVVRSHGEDVR
jgi:hypothetical protein